MSTYQSSDVLATAASFLQQMRTASLATTDKNNQPHAANVQYFSNEHCHLFFISSPASDHALHVAENPQVAMTIYGPDDRPEMIHGVQLHGLCRPLSSGDAYAQAWAGYVNKFPFVTEPAFAAIAKTQTLYQVTPTWLRWINNRVRFGFKQQWPAAD